jgi:Fe-S-cluster containining protein
MPEVEPSPALGEEVRRFACTSCGKCCDRGPEMELSEATDLADTFVTSLILKTQSVPLDERTHKAAQWWRDQQSRIPLRAAFREKRRHLSQFSSRRRVDRQNGREIYLEISAIVEEYGNASCPALADGRCGIYDHRPLTCRTVPLHYSRQPSALKSYIDRFTKTPGYECNTTTGPVILDGSNVLSADLHRYRDRAVAMAKSDRKWKGFILSFMDDYERADRAGLPTYEAVLANSDHGYATLVPMILAWRVAEAHQIISSTELMGICSKQVTLIKAEIARLPSAANLRELLPLYEAGAVGKPVIAKAM